MVGPTKMDQDGSFLQVLTNEDEAVSTHHVANQTMPFVNCSQFLVPLFNTFPNHHFSSEFREIINLVGFPIWGKESQLLKLGFLPPAGTLRKVCRTGCTTTRPLD